MRNDQRFNILPLACLAVLAMPSGAQAALVLEEGSDSAGNSHASAGPFSFQRSADDHGATPGIPLLTRNPRDTDASTGLSTDREALAGRARRSHGDDYDDYPGHDGHGWQVGGFQWAHWDWQHRWWHHPGESRDTPMPAPLPGTAMLFASAVVGLRLFRGRGS